ncbi:hypothetical protein KBY23_16415 [Ruegeria pomeroyi]|nr:hypothetical protein [Ruegeria pomeroyi]
MSSGSYLSTINDPDSVITPIDSTIRFPEILTDLLEKYRDDIALFQQMIATSESSGELLARIRDRQVPAQTRMSLLKMFRRCVAPVLDTEKTKKITVVSTESLVSNYGASFKPIGKLKAQFANLTDETMSALAALIGEYDTRGQQGYQLTENFFDWFDATFNGQLKIDGPRRAGRDIELSAIFPEFSGNYPCDFIITSPETDVVCVGFARYDSTRGGAQSDDRTGGNSYKVAKAQEFFRDTGKKFRLLFVSDGPGLTHRDTWEEACNLDDAWDGNVRVTTLKLAPQRVTSDWLLSS